MRPIVSCCSGVSERVSAFLNFFFQLYMKRVPSFLPNSTSLISDLSGLKFSPHCFLVTLDVSSLYTNISHMDAINTIQAIFSQPSDIPHCPPLPILISLLSFVLNNNIFTFNQDFF